MYDIQTLFIQLHFAMYGEKTLLMQVRFTMYGKETLLRPLCVTKVFLLGDDYDTKWHVLYDW